MCYLCCFLPVILLETHFTKPRFSWAVLIWRKTASIVNTLKKITLQYARNLAWKLVTYADSLVWWITLLLQGFDCKSFHKLLLQLIIPLKHEAWWDYFWVKPTLVLIPVKSEYFNNLRLTVTKIFPCTCSQNYRGEDYEEISVCLVALFQGCTLWPVCSVSFTNWKRISVRHLCCPDTSNWHYYLTLSVKRHCPCVVEMKICIVMKLCPCVVEIKWFLHEVDWVPLNVLSIKYPVRSSPRVSEISKSSVICFEVSSLCPAQRYYCREI